MGRWWLIPFLIAVTALSGLSTSACADNSSGTVFEQFDQDNDKKLSRAEFLGRLGDSKVRQRDFLLFDLDKDELLSQQEFRLIPEPASAGPRGEIPDPLSAIFDRAVNALDESYDGWQYRAEETVDSTTFTINYSASISTSGRRRLDRVLILHADQDRDRKVSRDEALRFLEIQLGIRWVTGDSLRLPDGRVVDFAEFLQADADHDDELTKDEFIDNSFNGATAEEDFERLDADQNGKITLREYSAPDGPCVRDPIEMFRKADTNLDALLNGAELAAATPPRRASLVRSNLAAFDEDRDGHLSLDEFRVSMLGNFNCPWDNMPKDEDRDQRLSFEEFKFDSRNLFGLQRRYYFHRLDRNGDGNLGLDEFQFRTHKVYSLHRISADGEDSREIYRHEDFPVCGSPAISHDGRWILFDATPPEGAHKSQILLMNADGEDVRDVCDGLMPSWSPDGSQFACSRYEGGTGVWIMNLAGTPVKRIDDGWAAQWSPDGKSIAYTNDNSIRIYDVESEKSRVVMEKGSHPYHYIFWNMCWSPDSRRLAFKGKLANQHEIATIQVSGDLNLKKYLTTVRELGSDLAWTADGRRILFSMESREHMRNLIYQIELDSNDPPRIVAEANTARAWSSICVSPDGKWMVVATPN